jgi:hypothetical protein
MSELKVNKVTPRSGTTVTLGDSGDSVAIPTGVGFNGFGYRNIVINGDMSIAQRGTSFTSLGGVSQYNLDRWETIGANVGSGRYQIDQSTDVPSGFTYSQKISCTTSEASQDADQQLYLEQQIEGLNSSYLKYYVASPDTVTLSFWVKSNLTGSYSVALKLSDNASAADSSGSRIYPTTYSISSANTWEKKSITITLDSTSEVKVINNGFAVATQFWLSAGTSRDGEATNAWKNNANAAATSDNLNLLGNTANDWYITGVQLEAGTTASDFEFLPYDMNLGRCQRYYYMWVAAGSGYRSIGSFNYYSSSIIEGSVTLPISMRTAPTLDIISGSNYYLLSKNGGNDAFNSLAIINQPTVNTVTLQNSTEASGTQGQAYSGFTETSVPTSYIAFSAEL